MVPEPRFSINQFIRSRTGPVSLGGLALAAVFLLVEHTRHVIDFLPFGLLLLCPLIHLFLHRGHGHKHSSSGHKESHHLEDGH